MHDLTEATRKEGILILSGILDKKESQVTEVYANLTLIERKQKDEWVTLVYQKN